ncbi:universal stress protein [Chloroflexi bacterium TSY]|nr:universal stress protein [Chloroflexi bacterium TSY]
MTTVVATEPTVAPAPTREWESGPLYSKAVIPTDNSELCHAGIDWAVEFAREWNTLLVGSHVYAARLHDDRFRQLEVGLPARFQTEKEIARQRNIHDKLIETGLILISDSFLDVIDKRGEENDVQIERKLLEGIHFEQIAKDVNSNDYDLVVMGAHGIGQTERSLIGQVTARVARLITTDMLVMKQTGRSLRDGKILMCVDHSAYCFMALRKALRMAKTFGASIHCVSAFDPFYHYAAFDNIRHVLSYQAGKVFKFEEQEELHNNIIDRGLKKVCEASLMRAEKVARDEGVEITTEVLVGKPFAKIVEVCERDDFDLTVMARWGAHHVEGADMGSNTDNLLRLIPSNLLIIGAADAKPYDIPTLEEFEEEPLDWDDDALKLILRAPPFAQAMAKVSVEEYARNEGYERVTLDLLYGALGDLLPPSAKHLMGIETEDRKLAEARTRARSPIEEYVPHGRSFPWTDEAIERVESRVPPFVRPMAMLAMERYAREKQLDEVTVDVTIEVAKRLGYAGDEGPQPAMPWTDEAIERLARVPKFEREMVREMVESIARDKGHSAINYEVADEMLKKIREMWEAQSEGAFGYFKGMAGTGNGSQEKSAGAE